MEGGDGCVEGRQIHPQYQRRVAQHRQRARHEIIHTAVAGDLHELGKGDGQHQRDGQPVDEQPHTAVQQIARKTVGPLGVQKLGEGRAGAVCQDVLQRAE